MDSTVCTGGVGSGSVCSPPRHERPPREWWRHYKSEQRQDHMDREYIHLLWVEGCVKTFYQYDENTALYFMNDQIMLNTLNGNTRGRLRQRNVKRLKVSRWCFYQPHVIYALPLKLPLSLSFNSFKSLPHII